MVPDILAALHEAIGVGLTQLRNRSQICEAVVQLCKTDKYTELEADILAELEKQNDA